MKDVSAVRISRAEKRNNVKRLVEGRQRIERKKERERFESFAKIHWTLLQEVQGASRQDFEKQICSYFREKEM